MSFAQPAARPPVTASALPYPNVPAFARAPFAQDSVANAMHPRASFPGPDAANAIAADHGDEDGLQARIPTPDQAWLCFAAHTLRCSPPGHPRSCITHAHAVQVAVRDYEFDKLEFARPSRMNKVFVLFSMQVAGLDILYTVFEVPTVCFCRREQKERAYGKLGVPYRVSAPAPKAGADGDKKARASLLCWNLI